MSAERIPPQQMRLRRSPLLPVSLGVCAIFLVLPFRPINPNVTSCQETPEAVSTFQWYKVQGPFPARYFDRSWSW
jgi:hypothetical protein